MEKTCCDDKNFSKKVKKCLQIWAILDIFGGVDKRAKNHYHNLQIHTFFVNLLLKMVCNILINEC